MTDVEKFEYKSEMKNINRSLGFLDISVTNGLECSWRCIPMNVDSDILRFTWEFDWDKLKKRGINRLSGYIIVKPSEESKYQYNRFEVQRIAVDIMEPLEYIDRNIQTHIGLNSYRAMFEYSLTPHYTKIEEDFLFTFIPSEQNDVLLVIDGKPIYVNRAFVLYQSEFFRNLLLLNDKNGEANEIRVEEISFDDFKFLLGPISPKPVYPTEETVEKLVELATRFKFIFVMVHCECYLLYQSKFENEKKMFMAEKYGMSKLLEKSILEIDTIEKARKWKQSPEYTQFSSDTKSKVFEKFF